MKSYNNILFALATCLVFFTFLAAPLQAADLPTNLIVKFKDQQSPEEIKSRILKEENLRKTSVLYRVKDYFIRFFQKEDPDRIKLSAFNKISNIHYQPLFSNTASETLKQYYLISTKNYYSLSKNIAPLSSLSIVEFVVPDTVVSIQAPVSLPTEAPLKKKDKNTNKKNSQKLTIAVVDTGVNYLTSLQSNLLGGYNILNPQKKQYDDNNHGTTVAEVLVEQLGEAQGSILPIKVFDKTGITSLSSVLKGLAYLQSSNTNQPRIINLSFAGPRIIRVADKTFDTCSAYTDLASLFTNTIFIAAAGNDNEQAKPTKKYDGVAPASCEPYISVGAEKTDGEKTKFSNYSQNDIYAPGTHEKFSGTSIATAYISGVLGSLLQENPKLQATQIVSLLAGYKKTDTSKDVANVSVDKFIADVKKLPDPTTTPSAQNIGGGSNNTTTVVVTNTPEPTKKITPTTTPSSITPTKIPTATTNPTPIPTTKPSLIPPSPTKTPTKTPTPTNKPPTNPPPLPTLTPLPPIPTLTATPQPTLTQIMPTQTPLPTARTVSCYETADLCDDSCGGRCEYSDILCDPRSDRLYACYY